MENSQRNDYKIDESTSKCSRHGKKILFETTMIKQAV